MIHKCYSQDQMYVNQPSYLFRYTLLDMKLMRRYIAQIVVPEEVSEYIVGAGT